MTAGVISIREVLAGIPLDGASIFLYVLLALCLGLIWRTGRSRKQAPGAGAATTNHRSRERAR